MADAGRCQTVPAPANVHMDITRPQKVRDHLFKEIKDFSQDWIAED